MLDWDKPLYPISLSSKIANHNHATGRYWYGKGWLFSPSDAPASQGATSLVSARSVLAHGIAVPLAERGVSPQMACAAARRFTDVSEPTEAGAAFVRDPGRLFDGSFTYLAVYPDGDVKVIRTAGAEVSRRDKATGKRIKIVEKPTVEDLLIGAGKRDGCWLLPLDFILKHVETELQKINAQQGAA